MRNEKREQQMMDAADAYAAEIYKDEPDNFHTDEQLCETINDFCAGWRAADQHPHWIPVEEKLPEEDGKYLFYDEVLGHEVSIYYDGVTIVPSVTHWMPLPEAPRKEE